MISLKEMRTRCNIVKSVNSVFLVIGICVSLGLFIFGLSEEDGLLVLYGIILLLVILFQCLLLRMITDTAESTYYLVDKISDGITLKSENVHKNNKADLPIPEIGSTQYLMGLSLYKSGKINEGLALIKEAADNSDPSAIEFLEIRNAKIEAEKRK